MVFFLQQKWGEKTSCYLSTMWAVNKPDTIKKQKIHICVGLYLPLFLHQAVLPWEPGGQIRQYLREDLDLKPLARLGSKWKPRCQSWGTTQVQSKVLPGKMRKTHGSNHGLQKTWRGNRESERHPIHLLVSPFVQEQNCLEGTNKELVRQRFCQTVG